MEDQEKAMKKLKRELREVKREKKRAQSMVKNMKKRIDHLEGKLDAIKPPEASLPIDPTFHSEIQNERNAMQKKLDESKEEYDILKIRMRELKSTIEKDDLIKEEQQKEIERLQKMLKGDVIEQKTEDKPLTKGEKLKLKLEKFQRKSEKRNERIKSIMNEMEEKTEQEENERELLLTTIEKQKIKINGLETLNSEQKEQITDLNEFLEIKKQEISVKTEEVNQKIDELKLKELELEEKNQQIEDLKQRNEENEIEIEELTTEANTRDEEIIKLEGTLEENNTEEAEVKRENGEEKEEEKEEEKIIFQNKESKTEKNETGDASDKDARIKELEMIIKEFEEKKKDRQKLVKQIIEKEKKKIARTHQLAFRRGIVGLSEINKQLLEETSDLKKTNRIYLERIRETANLGASNKFLKDLVQQKDSDLAKEKEEIQELKKFLTHEKEGFLKKQGVSFKSEKWRFFKFEKDSFSYFKDRNDKKPIKTFQWEKNLKVLKKVSGAKDKLTLTTKLLPLAFGLVTQARTFVLYASCISEKERWIQFLNKWVKDPKNV